MKGEVGEGRGKMAPGERAGQGKAQKRVEDRVTTTMPQPKGNPSSAELGLTIVVAQEAGGCQDVAR